MQNININATGIFSINNPVPNTILVDAALDVAKGQKEHFEGAPDIFSCGMGAWGATYHYTITVANKTDHEKIVSYQVKTFDNMIFGCKRSDHLVYETGFIPNAGNKDDDWVNLESVTIQPHETITFEIVILLGGGHGGTNNRIFLN